ncbi:carbon-nitrogen hydrolase family protein [Micromonospora sediminicola]|uniref:carbon-nitrogen hydrolase family protein n=1 Tax=Micromonospora sediminicola TaxID=946078 RepID=UPI0033F9E3CC
MRTSVVIGQVPTGWDLARNLTGIARVVAAARPGDIVLLPEGALSGYAPDLSSLAHLDLDALDRGISRLAALAREHAVHLFCGSLLHDDGAWWNTALYFAPDGGRWTYRKINLAVNERDVLRAGDELPTLTLTLPEGRLEVGVQLCREIRYPEQWQYLARAGVGAFVFLTNAASPEAPAGLWRSHLISRAAENQRFVFAVNVADPAQHCPSMVVSPRGEVLGELAPGRVGTLRVTVDLTQASDWSIGQQRRDVVDLVHRPPYGPNGRGSAHR